jgi:hypothetical protein
MKHDMYLLFLLVGIGIWRKDKLEWRGWLAVTLLVLTWIMYCWFRA